MLEVLVGLGVIIGALWAIWGLIVIMSGDADSGWSFVAVIPWILGILYGVGLIAHHLGGCLLDGC